MANLCHLISVNFVNLVTENSINFATENLNDKILVREEGGLPLALQPQYLLSKEYFSQLHKHRT